MIPEPSYSLYHLYMDIIHGRRNNYKYEGREYSVKQKGFGYTITETETGLQADCPFYFSAMLDFQGVAACLQAEKRNLFFDKQGNFKQ